MSKPAFDARDIPAEVLNLPVSGRHLADGDFGAQLEGGRTLLIFLRHLG